MFHCNYILLLLYWVRGHPLRRFLGDPVLPQEAVHCNRHTKLPVARFAFCMDLPSTKRHYRRQLFSKKNEFIISQLTINNQLLKEMLSPVFKFGKFWIKQNNASYYNQYKYAL